MSIKNLGCIGGEGLEIALDEIVCIVGANNAGKSTVLRAYELAATNAPLRGGELHGKADGSAAEVELWVHIPESAGNVDEKWKSAEAELLLVRSRWRWCEEGKPPIRETWDPESGKYSEDGKAGGADAVFKSRLPVPFRIGSLEDPEQEHKQLLELVLQPVKERLSAVMDDEASELRQLISKLESEAQKTVAEFREDCERISAKVTASYQRVFPDSLVNLRPELSDLNVKPGDALIKGSRIELTEGDFESGWHRQGTGAQRALFWSMLEARSELKRANDTKTAQEKHRVDVEKRVKKLEKERDAAKKDETKEKKQAEIQTLLAEIDSAGTSSEHGDVFLPGYMLLIDEPETALHPVAVRAAQSHLYALAADGQWQVMLTTHHPAFVDPLQDHTTVIRLHRPGLGMIPNIYRSDEAEFPVEPKRNLKSLLAFDTTVAEMFFASRVVIVEGDTELAAFSEVMLLSPDEYPIEQRPLIIRARGKSTILILIQILKQFCVDFALLHDIDAPRTKNGNANGRYSDNQRIAEAVAEVREKGIRVVHRCSCPGFEVHHGLELPASDKPFHAWAAIRGDEGIRNSVSLVFRELIDGTGDEIGASDGSHYEEMITAWAEVYAVDDPRYRIAGT